MEGKNWVRQFCKNKVLKGRCFYFNCANIQAPRRGRRRLKNTAWLMCIKRALFFVFVFFSFLFFHFLLLYFYLHYYIIFHSSLHLWQCK
jgi:hypothetical protein